jgi:hypothetical protein
LHSGGGKKFFDVVIDQLAKNEDALACFPEENRIAAKNKTTQASTRLPVSATVTTNAKQKLSQRGLPL